MMKKIVFILLLLLLLVFVSFQAESIGVGKVHTGYQKAVKSISDFVADFLDGTQSGDQGRDSSKTGVPDDVV